MLPNLLIALGILLAALTIMQATLRRKWVRDRAEVPAVLAADPDTLAAEHPTTLAGRLNRVRRTEAIHTGYLEHDNIRECDRESTLIHLDRAREATAKIRAAMAASAKRRVDAGVVTPAMPGAEVTAGAGHE